MNLLEIVKDHGLNPKKVASTRGGEYQSACPACGNLKRFKIHPNHDGGVYHCHACGKGGDVIQFLRDFMGKSFKEAADLAGKELSDSHQSLRSYKPREESKPSMEAEDKSIPEERWRREAAAAVGAANSALLENKERLKWLANRGITLEAVKMFKIGWVEKDKDYGLKQWGLPEEKNKKGHAKRLWIPRGYLIPQWNLAGNLTMLQARLDKLLPNNEMRYYPIKGSAVTPMIIAPDPPLPPERTAWVIVESRFCAILITYYAGNFVGSMAQGNNSANPTPEGIKLLDISPSILNSLDYDDAGTGSVDKWLKRFKTAKHWPVPEGGDPCEYFEDHEGDIREWVLAGLPPGLKIERKFVRKPALPDSAVVPSEPLYVSIKIEDGRTVYVSSGVGEIERLKLEGKIVFSTHEMKVIGQSLKDARDVGDDLSVGHFVDLKVILGGRISERRALI